MAEAFRHYALESPETVRTLRERLRKRAEELASPIIQGVAQDWADYRQRVGVIQGLSEAVALLDDAMKEDNR